MKQLLREVIRLLRLAEPSTVEMIYYILKK